MSNELLWYATRATAVFGVILLTGVIVLGCVVAVGRLRSAEAGATLVRVHRSISLLAVLFIAAHVITALVETYVSIDWISALIPFTSGYRTLWVGLGTLALDLLIAVMVTGLLRPWISAKAFRTVHWLVYALWPIALLHGWRSSSVDGSWVLIVNLACLALGAAAVVWRVVVTRRDHTPAVPVVASLPARVAVPVGRS